MRPYPLFPIGVSMTNTYVDEFLQSPIEFFIHDINHTRRMFEENEKDMVRKNKNPNNCYDTIEYYNESNKCLEKIKDILIKYTIKDTNTPYQQKPIQNIAYDTLIEKGYASIIKIIIFEIVHEDALPLQEDIICKTILRSSREPVLFPRIGESDTGKLEVHQKIELGGSILGFVKYKLRYEFFDTTEYINNYIAPVEYRTDKKIAEATYILLNKLCGKKIEIDENFVKDTIICNITDKRGLNKPVRSDIMDHEKNLEYKHLDYNEEEINKARVKCGINEPNEFDGNRPASIEEQTNLINRLLGGNMNDKYLQKYLKYKNKYIGYKK